MTRRLFTVLVCTSLLLGLATPVAADDPVDPAGQPVESGPEDDGEVGVLADIPTGVHDEFQPGDVFVAVSGGKVQWRLRDGTLNKILDTGAGGFTTGILAKHDCEVRRQMMANIKVSQPTDIDVVWPDVVGLLAAVHEHHRPLLGFELLEDWAERQRSFFDPSDPQVLLLLATADGRPVGMLNGRLLDDASVFRETFLMIDNMYVVPEKRRLGVGHELLAIARHWGRERGATEIRLSVVAGNTQAERFYDAEGFRMRARLLATRLDGQDPDAVEITQARPSR